MKRGVREGVIVVAVLGVVALGVAGWAWLGPGASEASSTASADGAPMDPASSAGTADGAHGGGAVDDPSGELTPEARRERRAEIQRELAKERMERLASASFEPAAIDPQDVSSTVAGLVVEGGSVEVLGQRCDPRPCVTAVRLTGDEAGRRAAYDALFTAALQLGEEAEAQPSMQFDDEPDADGGVNGAFYFVPNRIDGDGSELLNLRALAHAQELGVAK